MLNEIRNIRQHPGEPRRRWFFDPEMDVTVWLDAEDAILGFQLTYGRPLAPHALTWWRSRGYYHHRVDDGEAPDTLARKGAPILLPDGRPDGQALATLFDRRSAAIDPRVATFIRDRLAAYAMADESSGPAGA